MTSSSTPFFQGFASVLFGRPALSELEKLLRQTAALRSLADFFSTFGFLLPKALLEPRAKGVGSRQRRFSLHVTFWAFLSQVLVPQTSCRDTVRKVQAWWMLRDPKARLGSASTAAYTKARQRLDAAALQPVARHLVERLEARVTPAQLWRNRRVRIVDGTTASMPDTPANQARYPQPTNQKPGCGFPVMKIVGLFSLASGALLHFAKGNLRVHESLLFRGMIHLLQKGDVLLADRGFCSFLAFWQLGQIGVDALMRLHQARKPDFRKGRRLGPDQRLITWTKPTACPKGLSAEDFAQLPDSLTLRHVRLQVRARGHRTQTIWLVTSLLDPVAYPIDALGELYFQRWSVELHFREIKTTLGMDVLRCQSPDMVEKEVFMHSIAYNLVRSLMQKAALDHAVDLSRISFKGTLDTMRHWSTSMEALRGCPAKQKALLAAMLEIIATDLVPLRHGREEPRAKKRRAKNYHLLTKPRKMMKIRGHRNRPKHSLS